MRRLLPTDRTPAATLLALALFLPLFAVTAARAQLLGPATIALVLPIVAPEATAIAVETPATLETGQVVWLEMIPLESDAPAIFYSLSIDAGGNIPVLGIDRGSVLACIGVGMKAVTCRERFLDPGQPTIVRLEAGRQVAGRFRLGDLPIEGARVAVVPDGLVSARPLVMPLGLDQGLIRHVATDDDGRFVLPELAAGAYRLETLLPTGRLHHSEPFEVTVGAGDGFGGVLDLGTFVVPPGLTLEVLAIDDRGDPVPDAAVAARQGSTPRGAALYQQRTDAMGRAILSGFVVELPLDLHCQAPGHVSSDNRFDLVPVSTTCELTRQARIAGQVIGPGGDAPTGTRLTLITDDPAGGVAVAAAASITGGVDLRGIDPGAYRLLVSALGYETRERALVLEPGERHDLGVIYLGATSTLGGEVVNARDDTPLEGVEVRVLEPVAGDVDLTDDEGVFAITDPGPDQPLRIEARHPAFAVARVTVPAEASRADTLRIALRRGGRILVVVWHARTGRTCRGCPVRVSPGGIELITDGAGEALSELLVPGRYKVELSRINHLGSIVIEQPEAEVQYVRVYEEGIAPVWFGEAEHPVRVRFRPDPGAGWMLVGRSRGRTQRVFADDDGAFTLEQKTDEALGIYLLGWDDDAELEVEIRQGRLPATDKPREVVLDLPRGELRGRATSLGRGLAGLRVRLRGLHDNGERAALLATDEDGRFRVPHLPPGVYSVEVGKRTLKFVRISPRERLDIGTFDLVPGTF